MSGTTTHDPVARYALAHADRGLVLSHRLQQCITHAPQLEEELALANIVLDLLGQARALYAYAAERAADRTTEDDLAYLREPAEFAHPVLVEQPNVDFAAVMVRQVLHDLWARQLWSALRTSADAVLAALAGKAVKETAYHVRHASEWVVVLGDSTDEAHHRAQRALDAMWPFVDELFAPGAATAELVATGVAPDPAALRAEWDRQVEALLADATLVRPRSGTPAGATDRRHRDELLAELQSLHRAVPGGRW